MKGWWCLWWLASSSCGLLVSILWLANPTFGFVPSRTTGQPTKISSDNNDRQRRQQQQQQQQHLEKVSSRLYNSLDDEISTSFLKMVTMDGIKVWNNGPEVNDMIQSSWKTLLKQVEELSLLEQQPSLQKHVAQWASRLSQEWDHWIQQYPMANDVYQQTVLPQISALTTNVPLALLVSTVISYSVVSSILSWGQPPPPTKPYPLERYDPDSARAYFDGKLGEAIGRALQIATTSLGFGLALLKDKAEYVLERLE